MPDLLDLASMTRAVWVLFAVAGWVVVAGVVTWLLMGWDKWRAARAGRRIRESTLLGWAWLGGGLGLAIGMTTFRHKTRHGRFRLVAVVSGVLWAVPLFVLVALLAWRALVGQ